MRTILHIDFDSFFASCEQHFNPNLREKPIGVTAQNGRTCIIAASKEAKKYGIKTGTRSWEAKKILKDIVFVPADFDRYLEITRKFVSICKDYSPTVELFSIDEAFIDLTSTLHLYPAPDSNKNLAETNKSDQWCGVYSNIEHVVFEIKKRVRDEIGTVITVSIGISYNKLLAKLASGLSKPDGFSIIEKKDLPMVYKNTKLTDVCGIGERLRIRLNSLSIYTLLDLQKAPSVLLRKEFGNFLSIHLKKLAFLDDNSPVLPLETPEIIKSVGRNYCLPKNEYDQAKVLQNIFELCSEIGKKLRRIGKRGKTVGLGLCGERSLSSEKTIGDYINSDLEIFNVTRFLYKKWNWNYMVRQMSVWITNLADDDMITFSLFEDPKREKLLKTVDFLNERFGNHTVRNGFLLYADKLTTKPNGYSHDL